MAKKEASVEEVVEEVTEETTEEVIERPYTLRKLKDADLYPLLQLLRKIGLKEFKDAYIESKNKNKTKFNGDDYESEAEKLVALQELQDSVGANVVIDMADYLISKIDTHKDDIYDFYSGLSGISSDEIKNMEFGTLPLMIYDSFNEVKNTAFFKVLSKLL